jgi:hypothetical protein
MEDVTATGTITYVEWLEGLSVDGMENCPHNDAVWCEYNQPLDCARCLLNPECDVENLMCTKTNKTEVPKLISDFSDEELIAELERRLKR